MVASRQKNLRLSFVYFESNVRFGNNAVIHSLNLRLRSFSSANLSLTLKVRLQGIWIYDPTVWWENNKKTRCQNLNPGNLFSTEKSLILPFMSCNSLWKDLYQ